MRACAESVLLSVLETGVNCSGQSFAPGLLQCLTTRFDKLGGVTGLSTTRSQNVQFLGHEAFYRL